MVHTRGDEGLVHWCSIKVTVDSSVLEVGSEVLVAEEDWMLS